jgi:hypothetical protein
MTGTTLVLLCFATTALGGSGESSPFGYLAQPAYSLDKRVRLPLKPYEPQPGDILLFSDANIAWATLYALAFTGAPGHSGLVIRLSDGELGVLEAGYNDKAWIRINPLNRRLHEYKGHCWVRQRRTPISPEQSAILTEFAETIDGRRYGLGRLLGQLTPLRSRGPLRTYIVGKPKGVRSTYICSEAVLEGLVLAGLLDASTTRPSATYPRDLFFDSSINLYVKKHLNLSCGWEVPALWRCGD